MATKTRVWTRDDLADLPDDGQRYEVLDGALLVTPQASVPHQVIAHRLGVLLEPYVDRHRLGFVAGPGAVQFDKSELQPDVLVVPFTGDRFPMEWARVPHPILVVEILSRSTAARDLGAKREAYTRLGLPEYWVIDLFARRVVVWRRGDSEPTIVTSELRWQPRDDIEPLLIPLEGLIPFLVGAEQIDDAG